MRHLFQKSIISIILYGIILVSMMKFFDRERELRALSRVWGSTLDGKFNLVVISGRRGVGKTRLVLEFARRSDVPHIYVFVDKKGLDATLSKVNNMLRRILGSGIPYARSIRDLLLILRGVSAKKPVMLIFDEFQNFSHFDSGIYAELQEVVDLLKFSEEPVRVVVVVIGSIVGMMRNIFESREAPLYGRKTMEIFLRPFRFWMVRRMLRELGSSDEEEVIALYSILGGMPKYYDTLDRLGFRFRVEDVLDYMFAPEYAAWKAVRGELIEEFREAYPTYFLILEAISRGMCTPEEISSYTGIKQNSLPKYLGELTNYFEIVVRRYPITEGPRSKRGRYFLFDPFYTFWFRYVHPNIDFIEIGDTETLKRIVLDDINQHVSRVFEDIARDTLLAISGRFNKDYGLPLINRIGAWWDRRGNEINIVGMYGEKVTLVGEIKYTSKPTTAREITRFLEKLHFIKAKNATRVYISKQGFTRGALEAMNEEGVIGLELSDLIDMWERLPQLQ